MSDTYTTRHRAPSRSFVWPIPRFAKLCRKLHLTSNNLAAMTAKKPTLRRPATLGSVAVPPLIGKTSAPAHKRSGTTNDDELAAPQPAGTVEGGRASLVQLPERREKLRYGWRIDIEALPKEEQTTAMVRRIQWLQDHPDTKAKRRIQALLQEAHLDAQVCQSPELSRFVALMRELLHGHHPGEKLEHILSPLWTLLSMNGGGPKPKAHVFAEWERRVSAKEKGKRRNTSQRDIYEDVAAEWTDEKRLKKAIKWTAVRDQILAIRKRREAET